MLSVRLSSVITGWGGNDTTRSRRSTRARTRSMKGTNKVSCPLTVRLYRPSRSMTAASACGISATDLATTMMPNITITANNTRPATAPCIGVPLSLSAFRSRYRFLKSTFEDHRRSAIDAHDSDRLVGFVDITVIERACCPNLAIEFHLAFITRNPLQQEGAFSLQPL